MKGKVAPGVLCLVLHPPFDIPPDDGWAGSVVRVIEPTSSVITPLPIYQRWLTVPWWYCEHADGRKSAIIRGNTGLIDTSSKANFPEPLLMPIDPPDDMRKNVEEYIVAHDARYIKMPA